jgi:RNA-binding protein
VTDLSSYQRKYLRGLAHGLKPIVFIGQKGLTTSLAAALDQALTTHELVKAKFIDDKDKAYKVQTTESLEKATASELVGLIGHIAIFYRPQPDPDKRKISLPSA